MCGMSWISGAEGDRTPDLLNAIQALSQLSYSPIAKARVLVPTLFSKVNRFFHDVDFFPAASRLTLKLGQILSHLSHRRDGFLTQTLETRGNDFSTFFKPTSNRVF